MDKFLLWLGIITFLEIHVLVTLTEWMPLAETNTCVWIQKLTLLVWMLQRSVQETDKNEVSLDGVCQPDHDDDVTVAQSHRALVQSAVTQELWGCVTSRMMTFLVHNPCWYMIVLWANMPDKTDVNETLIKPLLSHTKGFQILFGQSPALVHHRVMFPFFII